MKTMAAERMPESWAACSASRAASRSGALSTSPEAPTRSSTSITRSYTISGSTMWRANSSGRFW